MKLIQVKKFNQQARQRFDVAVEEWKNGERSQFPFLGMYIFSFDNGEERKNGWVATSKQKHCFGLNKQKAINNFNKYQ